MGLKSTIFLPFFTIAPKFHSKFRKKFKNRGFENFDMFQGFKKAKPYVSARKLRLTPVRSERVGQRNLPILFI